MMRPVLYRGSAMLNFALERLSVGKKLAKRAEDDQFCCCFLDAYIGTDGLPLYGLAIANNGTVNI